MKKSLALLTVLATLTIQTTLAFDQPKKGFFDKLTDKAIDAAKRAPEKARLSRKKYAESQQKIRDDEAEAAKKYAAVKREFEIWYKGYRTDKPTTDLPVIYYSFIGGGDLISTTRLGARPIQFTALKPGEIYDKRFLRKDSPIKDTLLLITEKETPGKDDLVYAFAFPSTDKSLLVRFRVLDASEKSIHQFGPFNGKKFLFGPQTGPSGLLKTGKTISGKPLADNVTDADIISGKLTWGSFTGQSYKELLEYLHQHRYDK